MFGNVKQDSGRAFLVPLPDRSAETLLGIIKTWNLPCTTIISDCWGAYVRLGNEEFTHHVVNHSVGFVDSRTGAHTSTIDATSKQVKDSISAYNRKVHYIFYPAETMFGAVRRVHLHCQKNGLVSASSTHHCHTDTVLPLLRWEFPRSGWPIL